MTYGLACSPFLAMCTLRQLADDEEARFPEGSAVLCRDVYMDDILTGAPSIDEVRDLQRQLAELCMAGGFRCVNGQPTSPTYSPTSRRSTGCNALISWRPQESHSALGLQWHPSIDCFSFAIGSIAVSAFTKGSVLSLTARFFDPLGWLTPAVIRAKILFQATWLQGIGWDDPLGEADARLWQCFQYDLPRLEEIRVSRYVLSGAADSPMELHGFADTSERAYAAVVYLWADHCKGDTEVRLVAAKTKVAPLKQISLPRLELCAATLLVRLTAHVRQTIGALEAPVHLWSDSTVALSWIRGHPSRWQTYVANRVAEIQTTLPEAQWHHIPGVDNPADCASRGISLLRGPLWLLAGLSSWAILSEPIFEGCLPEERARARAVAVQLAKVDEPDELTRFSTLTRLLRVTAWVRRWLRRRKAALASTAAPDFPLSGESLSASECDDARLAWIRVAQAANYEGELKTLAQRGTLPIKNPLTKLTPFIDPQGILRRRADRARAVVIRREAPGDSAPLVALYAARHRGLSPADAARRCAAHSRVDPAAILDSTGPFAGEIHDPAMRRLRAMAGGNAAAANGRSATAPSHSSEALPQHR